jgi:hypothetical protein
MPFGGGRYLLKQKYVDTTVGKFFRNRQEKDDCYVYHRQYVYQSPLFTPSFECDRRIDPRHVPFDNPVMVCI